MLSMFHVLLSSPFGSDRLKKEFKLCGLVRKGMHAAYPYIKFGSSCDKNINCFFFIGTHRFTNWTKLPTSTLHTQEYQDVGLNWVQLY